MNARIASQRKKSAMQGMETDFTSVNAVPPIVHDVLNAPGQPLDEDTRAFMEPRFGHDFSQVRIHTDERAVESAQEVNALAYTVGSDVVLGQGQYALGTDKGQGLLAHELTHVVQQRNIHMSSVDPTMVINDPNDNAEQEAESISYSTVIGALEGLTHSPISVHSSRTLQRQVTNAFTEEQFEPVREAFEDNAKKRAEDRDSCIVIVNKGLRKLFVDQLKGKRLGSEMEKTMARLNALNLADQPIITEFLDAKHRITKGTLAPETLSESVKAKVLLVVGSEPGWHLFGLSIMDGYHSVLLAVDNRVPGTAKIYWMDQIYNGFDEVTNELDDRITRLTKQWWNQVKTEKGLGYNAVVRIWPIIERLPGDFPDMETTTG